MAHGTRINGTSYGITGGKCLVGGTAYSIKKGKVLIGGTAYDISFGSPGTVIIDGNSSFGSEMWNTLNGEQISVGTHTADPINGFVIFSIHVQKDKYSDMSRVRVGISLDGVTIAEDSIRDSEEHVYDIDATGKTLIAFISLVISSENYLSKVDVEITTQ